MHLVISKPQNKQPDTNPPPQQLPTMNTGLGQNLLGLGGVGGLAGLNNMPGLSEQDLDPSNIQQLMQNPQVQSMLQSMLQDPQALQNMINQDPYLRSMVQNNPQMQSALNNPMMLQMMSDPNLLNSVMQMMQGSN
jgi:ubiquilin